jgi:hypothetical protein
MKFCILLDIKKITTFNKNDFYKKQKYERERQLKSLVQ